MKQSMAIQLTLLIWVGLMASSFPVAATIAPYASPWLTTWLRFLLAAALLYPWVRSGLKGSINKQMATKYLLISSTLVGFFVGMFESLNHTTALNTSVWYTLVPLVSVGLSYFWFKVPARPVMVMGFITGASGAVWVLLTSRHNELFIFSPKGDGLFLLACVSLSLHVVFTKQWLTKTKPKFGTFWILAFGSVLLTPVALWRAAPGEVDWPNMVFWLNLIYLTVFTTLVTFFLQQFLLQRVGSAKLLAYTFLIPTLVALPSLLDSVNLALIFILPGLALTLLSLYLIQRPASVE